MIEHEAMFWVALAGVSLFLGMLTARLFNRGDRP